MASSDEAAEILWYLQIPEGVTYGPVARSQLDRWVREGRVSVGCRLRDERESPWMAAELVYPDLLSSDSPSLPHEGRVALTGQPVDARDFSAPGSGATAAIPRPLTQLPHRGPLVLTLGVVGLLVFCPVFSVLAWSFGTQDLREMQLGLMDSKGETSTRLGRMLGMVIVLIWVMMFVAGAVAGAMYWIR